MFILQENFSAQELCESRSGRAGLPAPNKTYGVCGRKKALRLQEMGRRKRDGSAV